ncbi:MAG: type II toxin-antitoxin system VapC family toxin [Pyrinomonadaceae bacterium]
MIVVVDASVIIKWYVEEIHDAEAELLLEGNFEIHCPELVISELGNIIWKKTRRGEISDEKALRIAAALLEQDITFHPQKSLLTSSLVGAISTAQTVYDWTYLSLAISLCCKFITADSRSYKAICTTNYKDNIFWIGDIPDLI